MSLISNEKICYALVLSKIDGVGAVNARKIQSKYPNVSELFTNNFSRNLECEGISPIVFERIKSFKDFKVIDNEMQFILDNNIQVILYSDENYPTDLKECYDAPFVLFFKGSINFNNNKIISVVGTRNVTSYGIGFLKELIQDIKHYNPIIVSGFAYGVDICAHLTALESDLKTIAILGHGLDRTYPKNHKKFEKRIFENGCFLTEFSTFDSFAKENFIKRNRIVAGISKATIVIESAIKGGSLSTAKFANDYNRDVFALPGRNTDTYSSGCNHLIKTNRANLITSADDLVYLLNWDDKKKTNNKVKTFEIPSNLSDEEKKVVLFFAKKWSSNFGCNCFGN